MLASSTASKNNLVPPTTTDRDDFDAKTGSLTSRFFPRDEWVPHKVDLVSALPTSPGVASFNGSRPHSLLDFYGILCGSGVAIWCKQQTVECVVR